MAFGGTGGFPLVALCWAYHVGIYKDKDKPLKRKLKSNARPQASLFALGLDVLIEGLRLVFFNNDKTVFRQLVSFLTPKPMKIGWG